MAAPTAAVHPGVLWAQRQKLIFVTIEVSDTDKPEIKLEKDRLYFKGMGGSEKKTYELEMKFFKEIVPDKSKYAVRPMHIEFALEKAEEGYWDRLLETKVKQHWLKVDFQKWKDEDDSDDEQGGGGGDLEEMMRNMGGFGGGDMGGAGGFDMGDLGQRPDLGDLDDEEDSDDEQLPGLE